jgi:hypothetical protein
MILKKSFLYILVNSIILFGLIFLADKNMKINTKELSKDSMESVYLAYFLATEGFHSMDGESPSYFREPAISALNAINILRLQPESNNLAPLVLCQDPALILEITKINLVYLVFIYLLTFALARKLDVSMFLATCASLVPIAFFAVFTSYITSVNSELPSAILLLLLGLLIVFYIERKLKRFLLLAGLTFGLLALTKAAFLYIFIVVVPVLFLYGYLRSNNSNLFNPRVIGFFLLAFTVPVASWMTRNYLQAGNFSLTERGGEVLLIRAIKNQMTPVEFRGGFYAYAPEALQKNYFEKILGYEEKDLAYGGKLQRLNRGHLEDSVALAEGRGEDLVSYLRIAQFKFRNDERLMLDGSSSQDRDVSSKGLALKMILNHPINHLKTSFLYGWRGIWFYKGRQVLPVLLTFCLYASLLFLFMLGIIKRNDTLFLITLVPVLYFLFHAFLTHFIPRYSGPLVPLLSVYLFFMINILFSKLNERYFLKQN